MLCFTAERGENSQMNNKERIDARAEKAKNYFMEGYNCTQAVVLAFEDILPIEKEALAKIASPFGGGMSRLREVCGAVSGMFMVEGLVLGYSSPADKEGKIQLYAKVRGLAGAYSDKNGSIICRELLSGVPHTDGGIPETRTDEYYKKRPCGELIYRAAQILAEHLISEGIEGI